MKDYRMIHRTCADCGKSFIISKELQQVVEENGLKLPRRCKECRDARRSNITIKCIDCGEEFQVSSNELKFYTERGLHTPKRCLKCRELKKGKKNGQGTAKEN